MCRNPGVQSCNHPKKKEEKKRRKKKRTPGVGREEEGSEEGEEGSGRVTTSPTPSKPVRRSLGERCLFLGVGRSVGLVVIRYLVLGAALDHPSFFVDGTNVDRHGNQCGDLMRAPSACCKVVSTDHGESIFQCAQVRFSTTSAEQNLVSIVVQCQVVTTESASIQLASTAGCPWSTTMKRTTPLPSEPHWNMCDHRHRSVRRLPPSNHQSVFVPLARSIVACDVVRQQRNTGVSR